MYVSNDHENNRKLSGFARIYIGGEETVIKRGNGEEVMIENCVMCMSLFAEDFCKGDRAEAARVFHSVDEVIGRYQDAVTTPASAFASSNSIARTFLGYALLPHVCACTNEEHFSLAVSVTDLCYDYV
eukprot:1936-Heterococcus_DN1.PRE.3